MNNFPVKSHHPRSFRFHRNHRRRRYFTDLRQTEEWGRFLKSCGWVVEKVGETYCFIKKIPLTPFSIMKMQRFDGDVNWNDFNKLKHKHKIIYSSFEPNNKVITLKKIESFLPTKTIFIDLMKSKETLWKNLSNNSKRIINREDGVVVKKVRGERFLREWKKSNNPWSWDFVKEKKLIQAFGNKACMLISKKGNKWLSGILILKSEDAYFYFQTWTNKEGRKLGAHYKLVWEAILDAKNEGLSYFDFEGVEDSRFPRKSWAGFSEFKKKFGGKEVLFPGCFGRWF